MAIERFWESQGPFAFTADGTDGGLITISSGHCLKTKQKVVVSATGEPNLPLQVKRVISPTQLYVGPIRTNQVTGNTANNLKTRADISAYTVAKAASIRAEEQGKLIPTMIPHILQAVYEQEPTVALRNMWVDKYGRAWGTDNPVPIEGTISATVDVEHPDTQQILNVPAPNTANTEFSISLPDNTKRYWLKVRKHSASGAIAFNPGETTTNYWTLERGSIFDSDRLDLPISSTIYIQINKADEVVEVVVSTKS